MDVLVECSTMVWLSGGKIIKSENISLRDANKNDWDTKTTSAAEGRDVHDTCLYKEEVRKEILERQTSVPTMNAVSNNLIIYTY